MKLNMHCVKKLTLKMYASVILLCFRISTVARYSQGGGFTKSMYYYGSYTNNTKVRNITVVPHVLQGATVYSHDYDYHNLLTPYV